MLRTGTDNVPFTGADDLPVVGAGSCAGRRSHAADYSGLAVPSVWRTDRTAAAKVDALASSGMDDFEIPAFLRKQAD